MNYRGGTLMIAIILMVGTIYDCNLKQIGPNMTAMSKSIGESRDFNFWTNLAKTSVLRLQSYYVVFERDPCNHIWSFL